MIYNVAYIPPGLRLSRRPAGSVKHSRTAHREPITGAALALNRSRLLIDEHDPRGLACNIVDASKHGCRIALTDPAARMALRKIGAEYILELNDNIWVQVRLCWHQNDHRGLKIIRKLHRL